MVCSTAGIKFGKEQEHRHSLFWPRIGMGHATHVRRAETMPLRGFYCSERSVVDTVSVALRSGQAAFDESVSYHKEEENNTRVPLFSTVVPCVLNCVVSLRMHSLPTSH